MGILDDTIVMGRPIEVDDSHPMDAEIRRLTVMQPGSAIKECDHCGDDMFVNLRGQMTVLCDKTEEVSLLCYRCIYDIACEVGRKKFGPGDLDFAGLLHDVDPETFPLDPRGKIPRE